MANLLTSLVPLIIGSAVVPIQIVITILLLRSAGGRASAFAWVAGMTVVRLLQGLVFGLVVSSESESVAAESSTSTSPVTSTVLLVVGLLFLVSAAKAALKAEDPDAPPPKWMTMADSMGPGKAFALGAGLMVIGIKFWVFTLGAISAIGDASLSRPGAIGMFLLFVVLAESIHLVVLGVATLAPAKADAVLDRISSWLEQHNRLIVVGLGLVFGTWFLVKALSGLGVI